MSILGKIISINKKTRKHREELQRLHHEGKLQRILNIPPHADPTRHLRGHSPPTRPGDRTPTTARAVYNDQSDNGPSRYKGRDKGKSPLNAIVVDDEEVDDDDDNDDESLSDEENYVDDDEMEMDIEEQGDGQSISIPNGSNGVGRLDKDKGEKRIMSVSEDEHEVPKGHEEEESRYKVGKKGRKNDGKGKEKEKIKQIEVELDDADLDMLNSSDESIVEILQMPSPKKGKKTSKAKGKFKDIAPLPKAIVEGGRVVNGNGKVADGGKGKNGVVSKLSKMDVDPEGRIHKKTKKNDKAETNGAIKGGADKKARKEFWAAKGLNGIKGDEDGDEFESGTDYVGLD